MIYNKKERKRSPELEEVVSGENQNPQQQKFGVHKGAAEGNSAVGTFSTVGTFIVMFKLRQWKGGRGFRRSELLLRPAAVMVLLPIPPLVARPIFGIDDTNKYSQEYLYCEWKNENTWRAASQQDELTNPSPIKRHISPESQTLLQVPHSLLTFQKSSPRFWFASLAFSCLPLHFFSSYSPGRRRKVPCGRSNRNSSLVQILEDTGTQNSSFSFHLVSRPSRLPDTTNSSLQSFRERSPGGTEINEISVSFPVRWRQVQINTPCRVQAAAAPLHNLNCAPAQFELDLLGVAGQTLPAMAGVQLSETGHQLCTCAPRPPSQH